jgi:hypothetical protein
MAQRQPPRSLQRYWIGVLVLIIIAWVVYAAARGTSTPGPAAVPDNDAAPSTQS